MVQRRSRLRLPLVVESKRSHVQCKITLNKKLFHYIRVSFAYRSITYVTFTGRGRSVGLTESRGISLGYGSQGRHRKASLRDVDDTHI